MYEIKNRKNKDQSVKSQYLDPNHTHFLLIDNSQLNKFGGEIKFRSRFEKEMFNGDSTQQRPGIPVVLVVIEGGPNTFKCVLESLKSGIPTLVLDVSI
jgi:hypothetical protein